MQKILESEKTWDTLETSLGELFHNNVGSKVSTYKLSEINNILQPFDLVLFSTTGFIASTVKIISYIDVDNEFEKQYGRWGHCGILVNSTVLKDSSIKEGKWYILEVCGASYFKLNQFKDFKNNCRVRILDLEEFLKTYQGNVAIAKLKNNPIHNGDINILSEQVKSFYQKYKKSSYQFNPLVWLATFIAPLRGITELFNFSDYHMISSQFCAEFYKSIGQLNQNVNAKYVLTSDLIYKDNDNQVQKDMFILPPKVIIL